MWWSASSWRLPPSRSSFADELTSIQGGSIDLGTYQGVVYYVEEGDDFNVVTTLASADSGMPLRFIVTLSEDEHFVISAPGKWVARTGPWTFPGRTGSCGSRRARPPK